MRLVDSDIVKSVGGEIPAIFHVDVQKRFAGKINCGCEYPLYITSEYIVAFKTNFVLGKCIVKVNEILLSVRRISECASDEYKISCTVRKDLLDTYDYKKEKSIVLSHAFFRSILSADDLMKSLKGGAFKPEYHLYVKNMLEDDVAFIF